VSFTRARSTRTDAVTDPKPPAKHGRQPFHFKSALLLGIVVAALSFARPCHAAAGADSETTLKLSPETIEMGAFYNGAPIRMEGTVPSGSQVMVIIRGVSKDELFNKKGRVGPIWINTDKVHVTGTPSLFLRFSSADVHSFLDRQTIDAYELDELSVKHRMHIRTKHGEPDPQYRELIENSYLTLKKKNGSYRRVADRVQITESTGKAHFSLKFNWPKEAPPGSYQVEVYACRGGAIVARTGAALRLVEVGFPAFMASLAHQHPYWYGVLAVLMAVIAGFGIDAIASRLRGVKKPVPAEAVPPAVAEPAVRARAAAAAAGATTTAGPAASTSAVAGKDIADATSPGAEGCGCPTCEPETSEQSKKVF
jgi:uncharacterized protein (TIGR02186 family)